jgi:NAD(P) transhydrogenase subunit alpha
VKLSIPGEQRTGERRVALTPDVVSKLSALGVTVAVEAGAGAQAFYPDDAYADAGAEVAPDVASLMQGTDVVARVQPPSAEEIASLPDGVTTISFLQPTAQVEVVSGLAARGATVLSLDLLPRISRAQSMDALSSQATVSGYLAGLAAAELLPRFFPMFMTAAGTVPPARVLVMGAGVAGLQAIATARRLGAKVRAYDVRAAAKDEVQSLGAAFVELPLATQEGAGGYAREQSEEFLAQQRALIAKEIAASDAVITTAAIPGRRAPVLVTAEMVEGMAPGSVVIDLAVDTGGNCELTELGHDVVRNGVNVRGLSNAAAAMPMHASFLFARNVTNLVSLLVKEGELAVDFDDEIVAGCCVVRAGEVVHEATKALMGGASA